MTQDAPHLSKGPAAGFGSLESSEQMLRVSALIMIREFLKKAIRVAANARILALPRRMLARAAAYAVAVKGGVLFFYPDEERFALIPRLQQIREESGTGLSLDECYRIYTTVRSTAKVAGDLAEVGVFRGGSAKVICEAKEERRLHLFDTFEGIPKVDSIDLPHFHQGQYAAPLDEVRNYLRGYAHVSLYAGPFPETASTLGDVHFSFVHLDVDTFESTLSCLTFFYRRMARGGVIISHDYPDVPGVRSAIDRFFADKPEPVLRLSVSQCLIVKT